MIETIYDPVLQITCDHCKKVWIIVPTPYAEGIEDARNTGWTIPNDGAFQWCPECMRLHKERLKADIAFRTRAPDPNKVTRFL